LYTKVFSHANHVTNLSESHDHMPSSFLVFHSVQRLEILNYLTGHFGMHSVAFARLIDYVITTAEPLSAFDDEQLRNSSDVNFALLGPFGCHSVTLGIGECMP